MSTSLARRQIFSCVRHLGFFHIKMSTLLHSAPELTIEQLFPCKASYFSSLYPNRKFGLKFWLLFDNDSKYLFNVRLYSGRDSTRRTGCDLPPDVCMKLMQSLYGFGYNVSTDIYFSSLKLANALAEKKRSPWYEERTIARTIRRQHREAPIVKLS